MRLLEYTHNDTVLEAHIESPIMGGEKKKPAVLLFHAWAGLDDFAREQARYVAEKLGYVGIAIDMYGKGVQGNTKEECMKLITPLIEDRALLLERARRGVETASNLEIVDNKRIATLGFCFGGLCGLDLARNMDNICATIAFHANLTPPPNKALNKISSSLLVVHGHKDPLVPKEQVDNFMQEMDAADADWQLVVLGQALHAFTVEGANDPEFGTVYDALSAKRAFKMAENFLKERFSAVESNV